MSQPVIDVDVDSVADAIVSGRQAVRRAIEGDATDLHRILAAGYSAAIFIFREPKLWPLARALKRMLKNGDPGAWREPVN